MLDNAVHQEFVNLAQAADQAGCMITLSGEKFALLLQHIPTGDVNTPQSGAPRENADGSPCWCNGPYSHKESHHVFCRFRREGWEEFCRRIVMDVEAIEYELSRQSDQAVYRSETINELLMCAYDVYTAWELLQERPSHERDIEFRRSILALKWAADTVRKGGTHA